MEIDSPKVTKSFFHSLPPYYQKSPTNLIAGFMTSEHSLM